MTYEEAKKAIRDNYPPARYSILRESLDMAIEEFEKAEKYRWHDLRKNPNDLPKNLDEVVLTEHEVFWIKCYNVCHYTDIGFEDGINPPEVLNKNVIAWREIEPSEEEK